MMLCSRMGRRYHDVASPDFFNAPLVDLFFGGFPCQPFSSAGLKGGFADTSGRGIIVFFLIQYIERKKPATFILENVKGLVTVFKHEFAEILDMLQNIKDSRGNTVYAIDWKVLNAREHGGAPHNRERVFIVGIRNNIQNHKLMWPSLVASSGRAHMCRTVCFGGDQHWHLHWRSHSQVVGSL